MNGNGQLPIKPKGMVQFMPSYSIEAEEFYRLDLRAEHDSRLEFVDGRALRTSLAGLVGIQTSFGRGAAKENNRNGAV